MKNAKGDLTQGGITRTLLAFTLPMIAGAMLQQCYNIADTLIVGRFVGPEALAAVGSAYTLMVFITSILLGLSMGSGTVVSLKYGAGDADGVRRSIGAAFVIVGAATAMLTALSFLLIDEILILLQVPHDVYAPMRTYLWVIFVGIVFTFLYNFYASLLRAVGDSVTPLWFLAVSAVLNIALDLVFILVFNWGVAGAGIATIASQAISAILILVVLMRSEDVYRLHLRDIRMNWYILRNIIQIGLPAGLQSVMYNASNIIIQSTINTFGTNTIAAWTAYGKIDGLFWMIMGAFGTSVTTFSGQNFGAQKYDRIRKSVHICLVMAFGTAFFLSTVLYFWGSYVYQLFTSDQNVMKIGMDILHTMVPFYFTYVCIEIFSGAMRGTGDSLVPMILTGLGICVLRVVWISLAVPVWNQVETVILSYPITWSITSVLFVIYYLQGGWLRKRIQRMGFEPEPPRQKRRRRT